MREPIAIVGMSAVYPGAPDLDTYWSNIRDGVDAITGIPPSRIEPVFAAGFACTRGGFIEPTFDPVAYGIMPVAASRAEPDQLLALETAARALADAGIAPPRDRTGVILGRGGYLTPGMARLSNRVRSAQQLVATLGELLPDLDGETIQRIRSAFEQRATPLGGDSAIGLVPNLAASRIANRLDLRGPAYTIDAACASSLLAVDQACRELADRRCDVVLAGGVHVCHDVTFWSVFAQLGALSKSSAIRPFDRRADGILIGEGSGIVVLERLVDAERAGHRIYAVIRGTAVTSDGRDATAMRPSSDGQLAALDGAWRAAERDPSTVGLIEAHGTATPAGDEVELATLARFFGPTGGARAGLGSVKSMIGHAMPAAGAAGLIKAALAVHHGIVPPSLHCDEPHEALARTRFRVRGCAEPWPDELPRLAGVSAFGFGGINAHVVIEAHAPTARSTITAVAPLRPRVLALAASSIDELRVVLDRSATAPPRSTTGGVRLALLDPTPERIALAHKALDRGKSLRGTRDIWFAPRGLAADGGKLAYVFPGIEGAFAPSTDDVARELATSVPAAITRAMAAAGATPRDLEVRGTGVFALGRLLWSACTRIVQPHAIAGHSMGEWTGMVVSEMIPPADVDAFVDNLPAGSLEVPDVVFVAVGCSAAGAEAALDGLDRIAVSHDNCPHQSILCGRADRVASAVERLRSRGVLCQELPFRSGFHSPLFADYLAPHRTHLAALALQQPRIPLWSATTCAPYPDEPAAIRALAIEHLVAPVRFRELIERMYADGVRAFVQLGVGSLVGFIDDTLRDRDHLALPASSSRDDGTSQLARVRAALFVDGFVDAFDSAMPVRPEARGNRAQPLDLGVPLVSIAGAVPPLELGRASAAPRAAEAVEDPVVTELLATLDEAAAASRAIVDAYRAARGARRAVTRHRLSVDDVPALADHCFYRQPAGAAIADRYPVVPMTMMIEMMIDAARALGPGRVAVAVENVRAFRWLAVAPAVEVEVIAISDGDQIDVEIPGYARATVRLADRHAAPSIPPLPALVEPRPAPFTAATMYAERWMFHGPAYQGVAELGPLGAGGVDGVIATLPAPGALLDCAGQLMGWWVMHTETRDRLAMPVEIERISFHAPTPAVGERVACRVRVRKVDDREVRADLELVAGGRVWARIDGWKDRRFDSDDPVWSVLMYPERNVLAVPLEGGCAGVTEHWRAAASRELMMRRYLGERERVAHERLGVRRRRGWLLGRIAIKDAVRQHLWARGHGALFPVEIEVSNTPEGRPVIAGVASHLRVSVAHKDDRAVAIVGDGEDVGIDLERIAPRSERFTGIAFTARELALGSDHDPDEWMARLWTAKEAVAKARGTGIGDPKGFEVIAVDGRPHAERLTLGSGEVVETRRDGDHVIAWTRQPMKVLS